MAEGRLCANLPSEAEWEKGARGTDGRIYPWGEKADPNQANCLEIGIGDTSMVGLFSGGITPYGFLDMTGNTWEWTRSLWGEDYIFQYNYPYQPGKKYEDLKAPVNIARIVRGGSFDFRSNYARCAYRGKNYPNLWDRNDGFRIALVSPLLLS